MTPPPNAIWSLDTKHLGQRTKIYDCLDSTNTLALSFSHDPTQHGLVVLARTQTAGRGQYGRIWQAAPNSSVLMSVLLFPPPTLHRPVLLTAWAAVSVCDCISTLADLETAIKWPNDVLIDGKKICGILIEQRTTGNADHPLATVVGVGFNVTQTAAMFDQAGLPLAASLGSLSGKCFTCEDVARALIGQFDEEYRRLVDNDFASLEARWKRRLGLVGQTVVVEGTSQHHHGRLLDVTLAGLDLDVGADTPLRLLPESVRHLYAAER